jgi:hypothetical protein
MQVKRRLAYSKDIRLSHVPDQTENRCGRGTVPLRPYLSLSVIYLAADF